MLIKILLIQLSLTVFNVTAEALCLPEPSASGHVTTFQTSPGYQGQCGLPIPSNGMAAAIGDSYFANSAACGRCVEVSGAGGTFVMPIIDRNPSPVIASDLDLTNLAFLAVTGAVFPDGRFPVTWRVVACPVSGRVGIKLEGSNDFYLKIRPSNFRYGVDSMFIQNGVGSPYITLSRATPDNAFTYSPGALIQFPANLRILDVHGNEVSLTLPNSQNNILREADDTPNNGQFPFCSSEIFRNGFEN